MDIYYEVIGKGFPLICLHGNGEDHHVYDELVHVLSPQYQLICIDSRYHGKSIHKGELSYNQMTKDVMMVVDELKLEAYDVIGFSDGGIVSLLLGLSDQRLKHIVCIGANTKPNMMKTSYRLMIYLKMFCLLPFFYNKKARLTWKLTKLMLKEPQIEYSILQNIKIPVLVMVGEYDMIKEVDTRQIGKFLPYGIVKTMKGGNHFLLRDSFQQTIKEIQLFLSACHQED